MKRALLTMCAAALAFGGREEERTWRDKSMPFEHALAIIKDGGTCWLEDQPELTIQAYYGDCGVLSAPFLYAKRASEATRPWTPDQRAIFGEWACRLPE